MKFTGIQHTPLQHFEDEAPYAQHAEFERNERSEDWLSLDNRGKYNLASPKFWSMIVLNYIRFANMHAITLNIVSLPSRQKMSKFVKWNLTVNSLLVSYQS